MSKIVGELNAEIMKKVIHDRRAKLFAEIVAKTGSKQSVIDRAMQEIESLREQVDKLTNERDAAWSVNPTVSENLLREQLAALAEQNEKFRKLLPYCNTGHYGYSIQQMYFEAAQLPDLASPVLNRIRAEGMRMAAEILIDPMDRAAAQKICAQADELENEDAN